MSTLIEGGGKFVDYINDFSTTDPKEWEEHQKEVGIKLNGTLPCGSCDQPVEINNLPFGKKPICKDCKKELVEELQ